jgi:dipeptidyl aminopeptidase/acylaminoacyl peptidase
MTRLLKLIPVLFLFAGTISIFMVNQGQLQRSPAASLAATAAPTPAPGPLTIAAIRAHALTPSQITTTQTLAPRSGCATNIVSFGSDGLTEYALMSTPPTAKPAAGYPVVILGHGYIPPTTYRTDGTDYAGFIAALCNAGYLVIKPDYRGNGNSQGGESPGSYTPGYTYDILNLTASMKSLSQANANNIAWLGHSMSGAVMLRAAVASHNLPVKAIIFASGVVGSLEDIFYNWTRTDPLPADLLPIRQQILSTYGQPPAHPEFWHDAAAINYVDVITAPIQINHGDADTIVPVAFSEHLDAALTAAGKPHELHIYPSGDHQYSLTSERTAFLANAIRFLNANLH